MENVQLHYNQIIWDKKLCCLLFLNQSAINNADRQFKIQNNSNYFNRIQQRRISNLKVSLARNCDSSSYQNSKLKWILRA